MRTVSILTAAALGLAATIGLANAQATNFAPASGTARALYGSGSEGRDYRWMESRAMAGSQRMRWSAPGTYAPRGYHYGPGRTEGIPPALYHAGDPQYWR